MRLAHDIAVEASGDFQRWLESDSEQPLIVTKSPDGVVFRKAVLKQRLNKGEFAAELNMSRPTFAKVEAHFGLVPSPHDNCYDRETVETVKRWLRNDETWGDAATAAQRKEVARARQNGGFA